jgi:UDP-glucose 4-epimerase
VPAPVAWVTGASGFIGSHVAALFAAKGWRVVKIDRLRPAMPDDLSVTAPVATPALAAACDLAGPPAAVFHGAGNGSVGRSVADPAACRRDTLETTETLLAFLRETAPRARLVFPSSAAVYGAAEAAPLAEDRPLSPVSPYGMHKAAAEAACRAAAAAGQPVAILRMFSVYGPGLRKQLPWDLGQRLLAGNGAVELFGDGGETRDFLEVADAAAFIVALATDPHPTPLVVNGGTGRATTVADFAARLAAALGVTRAIRFNGQVRAGDPRHYCADVTRARALGLNATVGLDRGLAAYAAWLRGMG